MPLHAQCLLSNPVNSGIQLTPTSDVWVMADISGQNSNDYLTFPADTGNCYIITTLSQITGHSSGNDLQITILDHSNGQAAPGFFNLAFHDDHNFGAGYSDPNMIWRPSTNGTYRIQVTKYAGGSCMELISTDLPGLLS